jgi:6-phosphogluconate dehydrogenase
MEEKQYDYGMIGLGTMGRNLVYNMADHGFSVAGFDMDPEKVAALDTEAAQGEKDKVHGAKTLAEFLHVLKKPRTIIFLVPAGPPVDSVIDELRPLIDKNDLLIDSGNSHFTDTNARIERLLKENIHFMGIGISGGEAGARFGPSIMPGGAKEVYTRVKDMFDAVSAKVGNEPCVTYLGTGSAGHYVKMVHNGIEYGLMQLIAETYQLLKDGLGLNNDEIKDVFTRWNAGSLQSFLVEIAATVFGKKDELSSNYLVDVISDSAHQKGTGKWTSQNALDLQIPIPTIDTAVSVRYISAFKEQRVAAQKILKGPVQINKLDKNLMLSLLEQSLHFSMITTYAQGMTLLLHASSEYKYELNLADIAAIWRGGCIIRSSLLEPIREAFSKQPDLESLLVADYFANSLSASQISIRKVITYAMDCGIPVPTYMASLWYYDSYRSGWMPANLIQAQRDYFGAHTYERTDRKGIFHTQWDKK